MTKVCILNSTTNVVENVVDIDDINNIPSFITQEGQIIATNHTGDIGDTWNGISYDKPEIIDDRTDEEKQEAIQIENNKASAKQKLQDLGLTVNEIKDTFGL